MTYRDYATDQYMRSVLADELTVDEADNALTALTALTTAFPALFPYERTFARPDHQTGRSGPAGVRYVVYGEEGVERFIQVPRGVLASLKASVDEVFNVLRSFTAIAA